MLTHTNAAAAVTTARKMGKKTCPRCGKLLDTLYAQRMGGYFRGHGLPIGAWPEDQECDYSEPEQARKGKR